MRKAIVVLVALAFVACQVANAAPAWKTHRAAFTIKYPANFKVETTLFGSYFTSPDGLVKFYAFHAWMNLTDDQPHPWLAQPGEKTVRTSQGANLRDYGMIQALDRSYSRDYVVIRDGVTPWRVFYIKYKNASALVKYQKVYNTFVSSFRESGEPVDGR